MGRDLLYKPATPLYQPEEETKEVKPGNKPADKLGVKVRPREFGEDDDPLLRQLLKKIDIALEKPGEGGPKIKLKAEISEATAPAYKASYFTKDVNSVHNVNQRSRAMQALRGSEGVSDLKKVVLPRSYLVDTPNPAHLREGLQSMGLENGFDHNLEGLLAKQGEWTRDKKTTLDTLKQRMAEFEHMVASRVAAVRRYQSQQANQQVAPSLTVQVAAASRGTNVEEVDDVAAAGTALVKATSDKASAMHKHIAKALGIRIR